MKKIQIIILWLISLSFFTSCNEEIKYEEEAKKDFFVEIKKAKDFTSIATLEKTWKLSSTQNIILNSNANWRVREIYVKQWDNVYLWQVLAVLDDNISNYWLNLEIAKNNLEKAKLNYQTTEVKLEKIISDIKRELDNSIIDNKNSSSSLELAKIENTIKKIVIDYDNLKISNEETIKGFEKSVWKELIVLKSFLDNIIDFSDNLLWVSSENKKKNDDFERYLWAKDKNQKINSETLLQNIINYRLDYLEKLEINIETNADFNIYIDEIILAYKKIDELLFTIDKTLNNSISSVWSLSETEISSYKSQVSVFQTTYNSYNAWFISLDNGISSFLETYKNSEDSLLKQIENLESDKKIYVKSLDLKVDTTESTLEEALINKNLGLKNIDILITDANIAYKQALKEYGKLTIRSPINWIIWSIQIDKWQEIFSQTPTFSLLNDSSNEVIISFNKDELKYVSKWDKVYYNDWEKTFTGSIYSIAKNADSNLKYVSKVLLPEWSTYLWNIVNLSIPIKIENKLLPLNSLKINNSWVWTINYLSEKWEIKKIDLKLWDIYRDQIEILSELDPELDIILNFVDNFDSEKFILKIK